METRAQKIAALSEFERWFDGGAPRIGETGAKGWRNSLRPTAAPARPSPSVAPLAGDDAVATWLAEERHSAASSRRPLRMDDDDIDGFGLVLFADVRPLVFAIRSPDAIQQLVYAFVNFVGVPISPYGLPTSTLFATDSIVRSELSASAAMRKTFWPPSRPAASSFTAMHGVAMEIERQAGLRDPTATPVRTVPTCLDTLFPARSDRWFGVYAPDDSLEHVDAELVVNAFAQLKRVMADDAYLHLGSLAFQLQRYGSATCVYSFPCTR